jgi:hypothetical protein
MDISFSEQDLQFQEEIRSALANDYPSHVREKQEQGMALSKQDMIDFHKFLYEKNWLDLLFIHLVTKSKKIDFYQIFFNLTHGGVKDTQSLDQVPT